MSVAEKVYGKVVRMKRGVPFTISSFYSLGSCMSVQKAMSRLAREGIIERVTKGFYVRPKALASIPSVKVKPSAERVAKTWAKVNGYKLVRQGQESAYRLGLQSQAPVKTIFWSNGPSREFRIGHEVVEVRHTAESKLRWAGKPEGALLRGLSVIPPESVGAAGLLQAFERLELSEEECRRVINKLKTAPFKKGMQEKLEQLELTAA